MAAPAETKPRIERGGEPHRAPVTPYEMREHGAHYGEPGASFSVSVRATHHLPAVSRVLANGIPDAPRPFHLIHPDGQMSITTSGAPQVIIEPGTVVNSVDTSLGAQVTVDALSGNERLFVAGAGTVQTRDGAEGEPVSIGIRPGEKVAHLRVGSHTRIITPPSNGNPREFIEEFVVPRNAVDVQLNGRDVTKKPNAKQPILTMPLDHDAQVRQLPRFVEDTHAELANNREALLDDPRRRAITLEAAAELYSLGVPAETDIDAESIETISIVHIHDGGTARAQNVIHGGVQGVDSSLYALSAADLRVDDGGSADLFKLYGEAEVGAASLKVLRILGKIHAQGRVVEGTAVKDVEFASLALGTVQEGTTLNLSGHTRSTINTLEEGASLVVTGDNNIVTLSDEQFSLDLAPGEYQMVNGSLQRVDVPDQTDAQTPRSETARPLSYRILRMTEPSGATTQWELWNELQAIQAESPVEISGVSLGVAHTLSMVAGEGRILSEDAVRLLNTIYFERMKFPEQADLEKFVVKPVADMTLEEKIELLQRQGPSSRDAAQVNRELGLTILEELGDRLPAYQALREKRMRMALTAEQEVAEEKRKKRRSQALTALGGVVVGAVTAPFVVPVLMGENNGGNIPAPVPSVTRVIPTPDAAPTGPIRITPRPNGGPEGPQGPTAHVDIANAADLGNNFLWAVTKANLRKALQGTGVKPLNHTNVIATAGELVLTDQNKAALENGQVMLFDKTSLQMLANAKDYPALAKAIGALDTNYPTVEAMVAAQSTQLQAIVDAIQTIRDQKPTAAPRFERRPFSPEHQEAIAAGQAAARSLRRN